MLAAVFASVLVMQQAASGQVVWNAPAPTEPETPAIAAPPIPDWARNDPYGYERSECSPLIRKADETMEACQSRVRFALAANLGDALPAGLSGGGAAENCRQEAAGDRYALQCGAPSRSAPTGPVLQERACETRPQARAQGGVAWQQDCRPTGAQPDNRDEGLRFRIGGND
ncbi:hypothetical protein GCM10009422_12630 [Brevundimonas kwangchunensis]|uniref:Uncharacterized protein n=1 Tax=Brevundimonas kwangchunensis TaxID=322163 RepID=A0ABN1GT08_9CAUL